MSEPVVGTAVPVQAQTVAFEELKKYLVDKEKMIQYPYLDANGDYTVCVGHMDKTLEDFKKHPWMIKGTNRLAPLRSLQPNTLVVK